MSSKANAESHISLRTGTQMPMLGLGTWELTRDTVDTVAHAEIGVEYADLVLIHRPPERLANIARHYERPPAQTVIRWMGTVPLPKANQREHLEENLRVFDFQISDDDLSALGALNERYSSLGSLPYE